MKYELIFLGLAVCVTAAPTVSPQLRIKLKDIFDKFDLNHDGLWTFNEAYEIFKSFDPNHDGHIHFAEYMQTGNLTQAQAQTYFKYYDVDKNGDLDATDVRAMFNTYDKNGDGQVTLHEFIVEYQKLVAKMSTVVGR